MTLWRRVAVVLMGTLVAISATFLTSFGAPDRAAASQTFDVTLFNLINQDRQQNGVAPLQWSNVTSAIAEGGTYTGCGYAIGGRTEDMIDRNYFAHQILSCGTQNVFSILQNEGVHFQSAGENIGWESGLTDPVQAAQYLNNAYMNSPEHRANILNPNYTEVGVGSWVTGPGQYWTGGGGSYTNVFMSAEEFTQGSGTGGPAPSAGTAPGQWTRISGQISTALRSNP